ncbi:phage tail protein [Pasteurella multocida]|nr:phage tail protein [Pasteurella multocida]
METFNWCIRPDYTIESSPRVTKVQFGDGYAQRISNGINTLLRKYPVVVKVDKQTAQSVDEFLARHKGVEPFYFNEPFSQQRKKVVCGNWSIKVGLKLSEIYCEFEEVP